MRRTSITLALSMLALLGLAGLSRSRPSDEVTIAAIPSSGAPLPGSEIAPAAPASEEANRSAAGLGQAEISLMDSGSKEDAPRSDAAPEECDVVVDEVALRGVLADETVSSHARSAALVDLGNAGRLRSEDLTLLQAIYDSTGESKVRIRVLWAAGRIGTDAAVDLLERALATEVEDVRGGAVLALRSVPCARATRILTDVVSREAEGLAACYAIAVLEDVDCGDAEITLRLANAAATSPDPRVRKAVARSLGHRASGLEGEILLTLVADEREHVDVRIEAIHALSRLDSESEAARFLVALDGLAERSPEPRIRSAARDASDGIRGEHTRSQSRQVWCDPDLARR